MEELEKLKQELEQNEKDRERIKREIRIIEEQDDLIDLKESYEGKYFTFIEINIIWYLHCLKVLNNSEGLFNSVVFHVSTKSKDSNFIIKQELKLDLCEKEIIKEEFLMALEPFKDSINELY